MKLFKCRHCQLIIFFDNRQCGRCGYRLGYLPQANDLLALEPLGDGAWKSEAVAGSYRFCRNAGYDSCNWLLPADAPEQFCAACRHNAIIPDLSNNENLTNWRKLEFAKHRLFYSLMRLKLPLQNRIDDPNHGLAFDFLSDPPVGGHILTGHDDGIITLALTEADDVQRESRRTGMHEPYRTLVGHFRHEIGHYYWDVLVKNGPYLEECRALFGDDRQDYGQALQRHYDQGAPPNWQDFFVSSYATSHPWEDFAESWAHYMHIMDSLETSKSWGLEVHPAEEAELHAEAVLDPYKTENFERLMDIWLPLTYALNAMNRSMGLSDIYPFVLSLTAIKKLEFIHRVVRSGHR